MKLLEKVLIPIDFRKSTNNIIKAAISLAVNYDSELILVSILPVEANIEKYKGMLEGFAQDKLNAIKKEIEKSGINSITAEVRYGNKLENILKLSRIENVNLVLVSSDCYEDHNEIKLSHFVEKLTRKCEKPVWVIDNRIQFNISKILCPVDFSNASERALQNAIQLSRKFRAELTILNVYEPISYILEFASVDLSEENQKKKNEAQKAMDSFLSKFSFTDVKFDKKMLSGKPAQVILNSVKESNYDLVIMGTTGRTGLGRIVIGNTTEKVIRELPCSFIATKSSDIINLKLETEIKDIEEHLKIAKKLEENGFYEEAIHQYEICLRINSMHIPSQYNIANLYRKLSQDNKAAYYEKMIQEVMVRLWDKKIEQVIRKHYLKN